MILKLLNISEETITHIIKVKEKNLVNTKGKGFLSGLFT